VNIIGPQCEPALLVGIKRPAKRPETNKGGREEEEKRLGISVRSCRPDRLRSAKQNSVTVGCLGLPPERNARSKKFQTNALVGSFRSGEVARMVVVLVKID
jgi:hypothetical protein